MFKVFKCFCLHCQALNLIYLEKYNLIPSKHFWPFASVTERILPLSACLLQCTTKGFFSGMAVSCLQWVWSFLAAVADISLGDEMSTIYLISAWSWLVACDVVLLLLLYHAGECLTLPCKLLYQRMSQI